MRITNDPDVFSVERDCYSQLNASSLPKFKGVVRDSSPDLHKVARRLSVQGDAPWGLDRIDTAGEPAVRSWRQQHHHRSYGSGLSHSCPSMPQRLQRASQQPTMARLSSFPASYPRPSLQHRRRDRRQL